MDTLTKISFTAIPTLGKKGTIHQVTTMLTTTENVENVFSVVASTVVYLVDSGFFVQWKEYLI